MKATGTTAVRVDEHGRIPEGAAELAAAKVGSLLRSAAEPVVSARHAGGGRRRAGPAGLRLPLFTERSASGEPERGDPWPHRGCGLPCSAWAR